MPLALPDAVSRPRVDSSIPRDRYGLQGAHQAASLDLPGRAFRRGAFVALAAFFGAVGCARRPWVPAAPLRIVMQTPPASLDPHLHDDQTTSSVLGNLYEGLTAFDADMQVRPALAVRWESPDDLTWRFQLRRGVRFHDGQLLTAADVVFSLKRARDHLNSKAKGYLVAVRDIRARDSLTVEVPTSRPYPILLNKLTFVMIIPRGSPPEVRHPLGTGPYRFVSYSPGQSLELAAFEGYWRGAAVEPRVRLLFVQDAAQRVRMLLGDELDMVANLAMDAVPLVEAAACCRVDSRASLSVAYLGMRIEGRPFSDRRVRRAIDVGIDREEIVARLLRGRGKPAGQLVTPLVFGYATDIAPARRSVTDARRLLSEAGFRRGLDLVLEFAPAVAAHVLLVKAQLAEVGIRVTTVERPWGELYPRLSRRQVGFFFAGYSSSSGDASDLFDAVLHSRDPARGYGENNFTRFTSRRLDSLIESSEQAIDMARRRALLQDAMRLAMAELALIPLWTGHRAYGMRRDIEWWPRSDGMVYAYEMRRRGGAP
ncbi:MAG: hypothetical protein HYR48_06460 [Gemmatimonadetes bacterium]|nr:hypothetical protein [Gemmatimonadota bacterium]